MDFGLWEVPKIDDEIDDVDEDLKHNCHQVELINHSNIEKKSF